MDDLWSWAIVSPLVVTTTRSSLFDDGRGPGYDVLRLWKDGGDHYFEGVDLDDSYCRSHEQTWSVNGFRGASAGIIASSEQPLIIPTLFAVGIYIFSSPILSCVPYV